MNTTAKRPTHFDCESYISSSQQASPELAKLVNQENTILEVTELIHRLMSVRKVTRSELAARLGRSKGLISQLLDGEANMTLRTVADIFFALDCRLRVDAHDESGPVFTESTRENEQGVVWSSEQHFEKWMQPSTNTFIFEEGLAG